MSEASAKTDLESVNSCDICGSQDQSFYLEVPDRLSPSGEKYTLVKCDRCGLIYLSERPGKEDLERYYDQEYYSDFQSSGATSTLRKLYSQAENNVLANIYGYPLQNSSKRIINRWLAHLQYLIFFLLGRDTNFIPYQGGGRLLDVGCGTGERISRFRSLGWQVTGVETSKHGCAIASGVHKLDVWQGDLFSADFKSEYFDVVTFNQTLEHMESPSRVLSEAHRILKDNGILTIRVPNQRSIEVQIFGSLWFPWEAPRHLYHFNKRSIRLLLEKNGFVIEKLRCDFIVRNFMLDLDYWAAKSGRKTTLYRKIARMMAAPLVYLAGYTGRGNGLVIIARRK